MSTEEDLARLVARDKIFERVCDAVRFVAIVAAITILTVTGHCVC